MFLRPEPELGWLPTHVQVTILQARGLRAKGKHGTSDAYTLIQIGREKYSTSVVEKSPGSPDWKEECTFELGPGALERGDNCDLQLTVMHRALIGLDQFLGQVGIPLQRVYQDGRSHKNQWYKLHSKHGKKEKERGEIQISIQFTRNNLSASMFDLSVKDKPKTPFGKLKDKMKVKKLFDMESSSAIVPSSVGRLDSDDESDKKPKSKAAAFFKGHLRKSSLTKSNTSLGSDSTNSATSGIMPTSTGISIVLPDIVKKPASRNSSLSTEPSVKVEASPRMTHKRAFSDEAGKVKLFPEPKVVQNQKINNSPISKSSVCINGSHIYTETPPLKPTQSLDKSPALSRAFPNIVKRADETHIQEVNGGPVRSPNTQEHTVLSPPTSAQGEERISKVVASIPKSDQVHVETKPVQITSPMVFIDDLPKNRGPEAKAKDEKTKFSLQHGKNMSGNKNVMESTPNVTASSEERGKVGSWFGSKEPKDSAQKPSFSSGSIATSEAAEWGSSLVEEHDPLTYSPSAEDHKASPYPEKPDFQQEFHERSDVREVPVFSSEPLEITSEWEEQFDAFASSRLQSPGPRDKTLSGDFEKWSPNSTCDVQGDGTLMYKSGKLLNQDHSDEMPHHLNNVQTVDTHWPETTHNDTKQAEETSSRMCYNPSTLAILPADSMGLQSFPNDSENITDQNLTKDESLLSNRNTAGTGFESNVTVISLEANDLDNSIAAALPLYVNGQKMKSLEKQPSNSQLIQDLPYERNDPTRMFPVEDHVDKLLQSHLSEHEDDQAYVEMSHLSYLEHGFERVVAMHNKPLMVNEGVKDIIKENASCGTVGSDAPPKPPRLMLSSAHERVETYVDNCQQTSNQDTNTKQTESPEEHLYKQNMGVDKQMVSPVTGSPVIEIRSPVLASVSENTQSTTEDVLANVRERKSDYNNDFTESGTANGEHLLDVNEMTMAEQFRTCPSSVSMDTDLSSLQESSNKLELINQGPSKQLLTLEDHKQDRDEFVFQKPIQLSRNQKGNKMELSSLSKKYDHSDVFWSALEEQMPFTVVDPLKEIISANETANVLSGLKGSSQDLACRPVPEQNNDKALIDHVVDYASMPLNMLSNHHLEFQGKGLREESQSDLLTSQQSPWSADIVLDFKNEDFWRSESKQLEQNELTGLNSPGNPFTSGDQPPFVSHKNPFLGHSRNSQGSESSLQEDMNFKDLHACAAISDPPTTYHPISVKGSYMNGSQPLAFSTPSLNPNPKPTSFPSPIMLSATPRATITTNTYTESLLCLHSPAITEVTSSAPLVLPQETQPAESHFMALKTSPHPVKPISANVSEPVSERKTHKPTITTALSSGLDMLKSVTGIQVSSAPKKQDPDHLKDVCHPDLAAKYYHLTHDELIQMLLQREAELGKTENHVRELEDYIDKLLVRIMDQAPTLLQAPLETEK